MVRYTRLNQHEIRSILALFDIYNFDSYELLMGGSENTNYLVKSKTRSFVLCILEQKTEKKAKELGLLLKHLEINKFNTSKIIRSSTGDTVMMWKEKPIIIKVFIDGKIRQNLSAPLIKSIGKELAKLHQIKAPDYLPIQLNYGKEKFQNVKSYAPDSEFEKWLENVLNYISPYLQLDLPRSLIHSDLFWDNVIIGKDETSTTIIDFEESANYYRIFDIGMAIIGICGEAKIINLDKANYLIEGYQSKVQLSKNEIIALKAFTIYAGASMTFWRHQNFNYINPNIEMSNHYKGLKVLVDYIIGQSDDCFVI